MGRGEGRDRDLSVSEICRERGWARPTFERQRREAGRIIARELNEAGVPLF